MTEANNFFQPLAVGSNDQLGVTRGAFERYFAHSRRNKGVAKRPTFDRLGDDTYADDHTQRHWWTWQQAQSAMPALRKDAERWDWLVRHASLGFDGAPSWNAVVRLPVFDADDQTITALVDRAMQL